MKKKTDKIDDESQSEDSEQSMENEDNTRQREENENDIYDEEGDAESGDSDGNDDSNDYNNYGIINNEDEEIDEQNKKNPTVDRHRGHTKLNAALKQILEKGDRNCFSLNVDSNQDLIIKGDSEFIEELL